MNDILFKLVKIVLEKYPLNPVEYTLPENRLGEVLDFNYLEKNVNLSKEQINLVLDYFIVDTYHSSLAFDFKMLSLEKIIFKGGDTPLDYSVGKLRAMKCLSRVEKDYSSLVKIKTSSLYRKFSENVRDFDISKITKNLSRMKKIFQYEKEFPGAGFSAYFALEGKSSNSSSIYEFNSHMSQKYGGIENEFRSIVKRNFS